MTPEDRYTAIARECVRLAELTDNQDLRSHLEALALDMMAQVAAEREDQSNVSNFLGARSSGCLTERSCCHVSRCQLRHRGFCALHSGFEDLTDPIETSTLVTVANWPSAALF
jgi:hypothetical protein